MPNPLLGKRPRPAANRRKTYAPWILVSSSPLTSLVLIRPDTTYRETPPWVSGSCSGSSHPNRECLGGREGVLARFRAPTPKPASSN